MLVLIQNCEAASGSYVALRINVVIIKELNLGNFRSVACKGYRKRWNGFVYEGV